MKEITRITTVELTSILVVEDETELPPKDKVKKSFEEGMKYMSNCDDAKVIRMQDFIRDVEHD